jgi:hypothetical protein
MTCYECAERSGPGGMRFTDTSAVGICHRCGKGLCKTHGVWTEAKDEFLCNACAPSAKAPRS